MKKIIISECIILCLFVTGCGGSPASPVGSAQPPVSDLVPAADKGHSNAPTSSAVKSASVETGAVGERLGLRIVSEATPYAEPELPDPLFQLETPLTFEDATIENNEIQFHRKIYLPPPSAEFDTPISHAEHRHRQFLVWPEKSLGSELRTVMYTHRVQNPQGVILGSLSPKRAWHDVENHRWFVPMSELFNNGRDQQGRDVSPFDSQLITLELVPEGKPVQIVNIRFQVVPPIARPVRLPTRLGALTPDHELLAKLVSHGGHRIKEDVIVNSKNQPYWLWVTASPSGSGIQFTTILKEPYYQEFGTRQPEGPLNRYYLSSVILDRYVWIARHANGQVEEIEVGPGKWGKIVLHPSESLKIELWVRPSASVPLCFLPGSKMVTYSWQEPKPDIIVLFGGTVHQPQSSPQSMTVTLAWSIVGALVLGDFSHEVRLTQAFGVEVSRDGDAPSCEVDNLGISGGVMTADFGSGVRPRELSVKSAHSCQGVFK